MNHHREYRGIEKLLHQPAAWYVVAVLLSVLSSSPALGLCCGMALGLTVGNPVANRTAHMSKMALQWAVILLGFGMHLSVVLRVGGESAVVTVVSIAVTLGLGTLIHRFLKIDQELGVLLSAGTAICGGSAVAALSSAMHPTQLHVAVAMAVIFLLNGIALIVFPPLGHFFGLTQEQFGFWAALAIHDTSSVVGAGAAYGAVALGVATTVKLTRALWIIPLSFVAARMKKGQGKATVPLFLLGFLAAAAVRSFVPAGEPLWAFASMVGKRLMTGTLFLIGAGLTRSHLKQVGIRPLISAFILWVVISALSLLAVLSGWIPELHLSSL